MVAKLKVGKGSKLSLAKAAPSLRKVEVRLYWDSPENERYDYDLDASALQLMKSQDQRFPFGRSLGDAFVCFYGQQETVGILSSGDDQEGGDKAGAPNETLFIDLDKVDSRAEIIPVLLTIHDATKRGQSFDKVTNARVELVDEQGEVQVTADLTGLDRGSTSSMFIVFTKENGQWSFENVSQGYKKDLLQMLSVFGVDAEY